MTPDYRMLTLAALAHPGAIMPLPRIVIALPGLLAPAGDGAGRTAAAAAPALARLLAAAGAPAREPDGLGAALAAIHGIERDGDWPLAAVRVAALGIDPGEDCWLAADPVTLVAGRSDVRLEGAVTDLAADEAAALVAALNAHFAGDGLAFVAPAPASWFVRTRADPRLRTCPIDAALHRPLRECLPRGDDAPRWRRWHSEIQMLLHEHSVNVERERQGRACANAVWFSQCGRCPRAGAGRVATYASGGTAAALAAHARRAARPLPATLDAALSQAGAGDAVVIALEAPLDLEAVDARWAAPAWRSLARRRIAAVTLIGDGGGEALVWTSARPAAWPALRLRLRRPDLAAFLAAARSAR